MGEQNGCKNLGQKRDSPWSISSLFFFFKYECEISSASVAGLSCGLIAQVVVRPLREREAVGSIVDTAELICVFVFTYAKCWFSHDAAHMF